MNCGTRNILLVVLAGVVFSSAGVLFGAELNSSGRNSLTIGTATNGPGIAANPDIRDLRTDFVRDWYIFADTKNDGILNPGDVRVAEFQNWWTPMSAATQHAYEIGAPPIPPGGTDYSSNPIDHQRTLADPVTGNSTFYMPQKEGAIGFYMTYSSLDNADYINEYTNDGGTPTPTLQQRNSERNGYAMGWLTGAVEKNLSGTEIVYGPKTAEVKMDIFVHHGKTDPGGENHNFGTNQATALPYSTISMSDPQVAQSNEMSLLARGNNNLMVAPDYRDDFTVTNAVTGTFAYGANDGYVYAGYNGGKYMVDHDGVIGTITPTVQANQAQFDAVVNSMDVREVNSYAYVDGGGAHAELGGNAAIHGSQTPQTLLTNLEKDGLGNLYFYEDSFLSRDGQVGGNLDNGSVWIEGSTDGGVIAGLSGFDEYSQYYPQTEELYTHWGEQQVIRIDFDQDTFKKGNMVGITEIIFYDWGTPHPVTGQQTNPVAITINVDPFQNLYYDVDKDGFLTPGTDIEFPDNRIYIAQVEAIPEPGTMLLLAVGAATMLMTRKRRHA
jgi:hypothetical protein